MANEGVKSLRKIQFGKMADSDSDTGVPATTLWRGMGTLKDDRKTYFVPEDVGLLTGTDRTNTSMHGGSIVLEETEATPEQLPHIFEMTIKKVASPTSDSGDGYIRQYDFPTTAGADFRPYTIEGGDNAGAEMMNYCFGEGFTLSGNEKEAWMITSTLRGKTIVPQAFTGSVAIPAVTHFNFGMTTMYIDNDSDPFGTTIVSRTLLQASFAYKSGFQAVYTPNGSLAFDFVKPTTPEGILTVTFEHNASTISEKAKWRSETARLIRLRCLGDALTVPGVTYSYRTKIIDIPGKWEMFDKIGERNGNDVVQGKFRLRYNATQASAGKIIIVNTLPTLL